MPTADIQRFAARERLKASRLNELVDSENTTRREFNERKRTDLYDAPINVAYILITGVETGIGYYKATVLQWATLSVDPSNDLTADKLGGTAGEKVVAILHSELGATAHMLTPGADGVYAVAHLTGNGSSDGRRVVAILSIGTGIIDLRYSTTTHAIEVTFDGSTWIPKVTFVSCSGPTLAEAMSL